MSSSGSSVLHKQVQNLPNSPGVYRFYGEQDALLYVGKAKSLRNRVRSYFGARAGLSARIAMMVASIKRLETTITPSEDDALVLENDQIKSLHPRYNILFRDDASYPYLRITHHQYPRIMFYRGKPGADCFGPFPSVWSVKESIRLLQRAFRLRTCSDAMLANRTRPCMLYQIGRCSAPCVDHISESGYAADAQAAVSFLRGNTAQVSQDLAERMEQASAAEEYERAAQIRDSINALANVRHRSAVSGGAEDADFIGAYAGQDGCAIRLAAVRGGRMVGEVGFVPANANEADLKELIAAFVSQHYVRHMLPARVVVMNCGLTAEMLLEQVASASKTKFVVRPRGPERERIAMCCANAKIALEQQDARSGAMAKLAERLGLAKLHRFDCFDVSHSMGEQAVGSCVVCVDGRMDKRLYRRMHLRAASGADDYAGISELVSRRYRDAADRPETLPDLVVVDGGVGQVNAAVAALEAAGVGQQKVMGIAKGAARKPGMETLISSDGEQIDLAPTDSAFHMLQHARDEAHRFALAYHRKRRARGRRGSLLDDIDGVGPKLRRSILHEFGGLHGLRAASLRDLTRISGVGAELARRIYLALHP